MSLLIGKKLARGVKKISQSLGFSGVLQQLSFWYVNQVVTAVQMNEFGQDIYDKIAAITDRYAPCVITLKGIISQNGTTISMPTGFFRFIDTSYSFMSYSSCICGVAQGVQLSPITGNGFIVARYSVSPVTQNQTNYTFPTQYIFTASVNPVTDCMVCVITNGQISSYGQFFGTPSINDNGTQVTVNKPLAVNASITAAGSLKAASINMALNGSIEVSGQGIYRITQGQTDTPFWQQGGYYIWNNTQTTYLAILTSAGLEFSSGTNYAAGGANINGNLNATGGISSSVDIQVNNASGAVGVANTNGVGWLSELTAGALTFANGGSSYSGYGATVNGNLTMTMGTSAQGIVYTNVPGVTNNYRMSIGWDGSHVRGIVDNNPTATFALANVSDLPTAYSGSYNAGNGVEVTYAVTTVAGVTTLVLRPSSESAPFHTGGTYYNFPFSIGSNVIGLQATDNGGGAAPCGFGVVNSTSFQLSAAAPNVWACITVVYLA